MNNYEIKKQQKIEKYKNLAQKHEEESDILHELANLKASSIPFGQPILIGHHSENKNRRYRDSINKIYTKSRESEEKAKYYADKANAAINNKSISSDDPKAIKKLEEKIIKMEKNHLSMKTTNQAWKAYIKKNNKQPLYDIGYNDDAIRDIEISIEKAYSWEKQPFPSWQIRNSSQNINAIKKRIEILKLRKNRPAIEKIINDIKFVDNVEANRLQLFFNGKPELEIREKLKVTGFRWTPSIGAWQAYPSYLRRSLINEIIDNS